MAALQPSLSDGPSHTISSDHSAHTPNVHGGRGTGTAESSYRSKPDPLTSLLLEDGLIAPSDYDDAFVPVESFFGDYVEQLQATPVKRLSASTQSRRGSTNAAKPAKKVVRTGAAQRANTEAQRRFRAKRKAETQNKEEEAKALEAKVKVLEAQAVEHSYLEGRVALLTQVRPSGGAQRSW